MMCEIVPSHCRPAALLLLEMPLKCVGELNLTGLFIYLFSKTIKVCTGSAVLVAHWMVVRWCHGHPGLVFMRCRKFLAENVS